METGEYTYEEYLENWEQLFGDSDTGEYGYYRGSTRIPYTVRKLSEEEFAWHLAELEEADIAFDAAYETCNQDGMDKALKSAFQHELVLLI